MSYVAQVLEGLSVSELRTWADVLAACQRRAVGPPKDPLTYAMVQAEIAQRGDDQVERSERLDA